MCSSSSQNAQLPEQLKSVVESLFPSFYDTYELICLSNIHKDSQKMIDPFGEKRSVFSFQDILTRLNKINETLNLGEGVEGEEGGEKENNNEQAFGLKEG